MRCDRVDFEPGGVAYRHTHPGPGIRYLLFGAITIDSQGAEHTLGPGRGVVRARARPGAGHDGGRTSRRPSYASCCCPWSGPGSARSRYVDPADADKPKPQRATIFLEQPVRR